MVRRLRRKDGPDGTMRRDGYPGLYAVRNVKFVNGSITLDFVEQHEYAY